MRSVTLIFLVSVLFSLNSKTHYISSSNFSLGNLENGDSVLFKHGERYFLNISLIKYYNPENIYYGSYGDPLLPKPVLDGSIFHFEFNSENWKDYEIIKGEKFYKKEIKGLESVENVYAGKKILTMSREPDADETVIKGKKNSFTGLFLIDSVDATEPNKRFYDRRNKTDWTGADIVTKTQQWSYERKKLLSNKGQVFEVDDRTSDPFKKNWGYFIQRHYSALDREGEWYYDSEKGILYFSAKENKCTIYISSNREENNSGFYIKGRNKIMIEGLNFVNYKHGILLEEAQDIIVNNCDFRNCIYGIVNKKTYLEKVRVENCNFNNMHSYGIRLISNNSVFNRNLIDSVGLSMNSESKGYDNLDGIESYGQNNIISNNTVKNVGYCAIRIYNCAGTKVIGNTVENTNQRVSDGGAIYSYHSIEGNKLIRGNTVRNAEGRADGTDGDLHQAFGIYLDELSLNFRVDSNFVSGCGTGIYVQNSRNDTIEFNHSEKSRITEFQINHAGSILNGGKLNPLNDPDFDPDSLKVIPEGYVWNKKEGLLYYKNKENGTVYVKPGNNIVRYNHFVPDKDRYTCDFRTWRNISDGTIYELTGNTDFFRNNVPDSLLKNASFQIIGGNVKDFGQNGKIYEGLKSTFDKSKYDYLKKVNVFIGRGAKFPVEK